MKKLLCLVLSLMMILSVAVVPTVAEATTPKIPDGANKITKAVKDGVALADVDAWADINTTYYKSGATWYIEDANDLMLLSAITNIAGQVNNAECDFKGQTIYLANDIDMSGITNFKPFHQQADCSNFARPRFRGTFDGQNFSIKNLKVTSSSASVGLFGTVGANSTIKNLVLDENCSFTYTGTSDKVGVGALIGWLNVDALTFTDAEITIKTGVTIGAVVKNVTSYADVTSTTYAGGLIGQLSNQSNYTAGIQKCVVSGDIYGKLGAAGIAYARKIGGIQTRQFDINSCTVNGSITSDGIAVGIVANGYADNAYEKKTSVLSCVVSAAISGAEVAPIATAELLNYNYTLINTCNIEGVTMKLLGDIGYDYTTVVKKNLSSVASIQTLTPSNTAREYKIETPADLVYFSNYVNGLEYSGTNKVSDAKAALYGYTIYLANNLDMTGVSMKSIGSIYNVDPGSYPKNTVQYFAGTFDGQGYTIDNLKLTSDITAGNVYLGLFGALRSATVKNVVLGAGCEISYNGSLNAYVGAIAGMAHSVEPNNAFKTAYGFGTAAGKANFFTDVPMSSVINCYSAATVTAKGEAGGIVGVVEVMSNAIPGGNIWNCTNVGKVTATKYAGGIVGRDDRSQNIVNCRNAGVVEGTTGAGGIVGIYNPNNGMNAAISNCVNNGTVGGNGYVGGLVGNKTETKSAIANCVNYANVKACGTVKDGSDASIHGNSQAYGTTDTDWTSVKFVGVQTKKGADGYDVRFLATVNDLNAVKNAGFQIEITYNGTTKVVDPMYASYAFDSVYFETANGKDTAYAGAYNGIYFVSAVITDIPNDANVTFNVKTIENGITATEGATVVLNSGNAVA